MCHYSLFSIILFGRKYGSELPLLQTHWPNSLLTKGNWALHMFALQPRGIIGIYTKVVYHRVFTKPSETQLLPLLYTSFQLIVSQWDDWPTSFFSPKKKLPTGAFSVIFTRENDWLLCLIRGTSSVGYQSWIFINGTIPLCPRKQLKFWLLQLSSGSKKKTKLVSTLGFSG